MAITLLLVCHLSNAELLADFFYFLNLSLTFMAFAKKKSINHLYFEDFLDYFFFTSMVFTISIMLCVK